MKTRFLVLSLSFAVLAVIASACGGGADEPTDEAALDPELEPGGDALGASGEGAALDDPYPGWLTYDNPAYGFSFRYPSTWTAVDEPNAVKLSQGTVQLIIGYRSAAESVQISGTGTGAGDFQDGGQVTFLSQAFPTTLLVSDGRVTGVYYSDPNSEISAGDLAFSLALIDFGTDPAVQNIPAPLQAEAAQVLESFSVTSGATAAPAQPAAPEAAEAPPAQPTPAPAEAAEPADAPAQPVQALPQGECTNNSEFVQDVTVPDGTTFAPGASFTKTWRVINNGTCQWTTGYMVVTLSTDTWSAPTTTGISRSVGPGETLDVTLNMVAPSETGKRTSFWRLANTDGVPFGTNLYVEILVSESGSTTDTETDDETDGETDGENGDDTPTDGTCTDEAEFLEDVTVPDGTVFTPGETFTKTWRVQNSGSCTWTSEYQLAFSEGDAMSVSSPLPLTTTDIAPGETLDISLEMTAPGTPGDYSSLWRLVSPDGTFFKTRVFTEIEVQ